MSSKTISTGTLGLRFMQNAQRAKQLKEAEFERAVVKDDGEWEVPQEVRDAWGLISDSPQSVVHETSYLPFLFPSLTDTSAAQPESSTIPHRPKGRRTFDKKGQEVIQNNMEPEPITSAKEGKTLHETGSKKPRIHPRPISISDSSGKLLSGFPLKAKTAKQVIYDNTGVGTDLHPPKPIVHVSTAKSTPSVFLKPSGIDDPAETKPYKEALNSSDTAKGTPSKKRLANDHRDGEGAKRKKKKKNEQAKPPITGRSLLVPEINLSEV